jgi:hypothetical protein
MMIIAPTLRNRPGLRSCLMGGHAGLECAPERVRLMEGMESLRFWRVEEEIVVVWLVPDLDEVIDLVRVPPETDGGAVRLEVA